MSREQTRIRISLWSGPRNVSTALMYSFAQRPDTRVVDEPLYAHYLTHSDARLYHPGADRVIASMEPDGAVVVESMLLGSYERPVVFFKNMAHHLLDLDWSFLCRLRNVILTRDPAEMLCSYAKTVARPSLRDTGYLVQVRLLDYLIDAGRRPAVLDARELLLDPRGVLSSLCRHLGIVFDDRMLSWRPGPRPEDGIWAEYWYEQVHRSSGFRPYRPKTEPVPKALRLLLEECLPLYQRLSVYTIKAGRP
ncbi:MAG: sulfotransferase family protein [Acidobacteriota bacterium]